LQSLRCTHSTHWLAVVSHRFATALTKPPSAPPSASSLESLFAPASGLPAQCLFCVQATHSPLAAQAGPPGRARQSLSLEHLAHRLPKHRGALAEQSLSVLQVPAASPCGRSGAMSIDGASTDGASTEMLTGGASAGTTSGASGSSTLVERSSAMSPPPSADAETSRPLPATARPSAPLSAVPPSGAGTHLNVSVHINPGRHGSRGVQTLQSRFTPQASPSVTGTTRIAIFKRTTSLFVISEVLDKGLKKLCGMWRKAEGGSD
jgi:hypothetical protein